MIEVKGVKIYWLGHAGFRIIGDGKTIYIDPYKIKGGPIADIILITHNHFDHFSVEDIKKISSPNTVIIGPKECEAKFRALSMEHKIVKPGTSLDVSGVKIETVPSYNVSKSFHPKLEGKVGFVITLSGVKIYHAGDTDRIPEMVNIKPDVSLLPVGGTYTMNAEEAAQAVKDIGVGIFIPMHYGTIVGDRSDAERFKSIVGEKAVLIEPED
ncbi:MAG: MBL fold metallo-hydrolase [Crenarchaeota archaeon]|nr:MBL fold metallo-hydrolase [Thermoproteota archaeon]MDW8033807.1 MBL fold metallo-hydrolase [Nitrososphaerota archaeon]